METNQEIQKLGKVHILGIGGAGMSGIARLLVAQGVTVSGSDAKDSRRVEALKKLEISEGSFKATTTESTSVSDTNFVASNNEAKKAAEKADKSSKSRKKCTFLC